MACSSKFSWVGCTSGSGFEAGISEPASEWIFMGWVTSRPASIPEAAGVSSCAPSGTISSPGLAEVGRVSLMLGESIRLLYLRDIDDLPGPQVPPIRHQFHGCSVGPDILDDAVVVHVKSQLGPLLKRIHGADRHVGKVPIMFGKTVKDTKTLQELKSKMDKAIQEENFEEAASLRDRIREFEKKGEGENARP